MVTSNGAGTFSSDSFYLQYQENRPHGASCFEGGGSKKWRNHDSENYEEILQLAVDIVPIVDLVGRECQLLRLLY